MNAYHQRSIEQQGIDTKGLEKRRPRRVNLADSFKAYDVRGIVGETITTNTVFAIGAAFTDVLGLEGENILVGGDMRPSSAQFMKSFSDGARRRGANITLLNLISTDELYFACGYLNMPGVTFTASHNPAEYNGIKMAHRGASPISATTGLKDIQQLAQKYLDDSLGTVYLSENTPIPAATFQGTLSVYDVLPDYARFLRSLVDLSDIRDLKVVVDAGNGMAGLTTGAVLGEEILEGLPLEIIPLYFELDGSFPNHPANPLEPANLRDLQRAVVTHGADIGLAFDGDADRCFVINEHGEPVSPSAVTALVASREIAKAQAEGTKTPRIIHNLITSTAVPEIVLEKGGKPIRTRVGHSYIKEVMAEENAVFGGEHSAHYYFRDFYNADTGMLAAMHVLEALGTCAQPLSELIAGYDPYYSSGEINSTVAETGKALKRVRKAFPPEEGITIDELDGITFSDAKGDWWFNVRASNTEPYLRLNVEAKDEAQMRLIRDRVLGIIKE